MADITASSFKVFHELYKEGRQEPDVAWLLDRVVEVERVRVRVRDDC